MKKRNPRSYERDILPQRFIVLFSLLLVVGLFISSKNAQQQKKNIYIQKSTAYND